MLVTIPTLFAKVNGLLSNEADYWQQLKDIKNNNQNSSLIYEFPIIPKPQDSKNFLSNANMRKNTRSTENIFSMQILPLTH